MSKRPTVTIKLFPNPEDENMVSMEVNMGDNFDITAPTGEQAAASIMMEALFNYLGLEPEDESEAS